MITLEEFKKNHLDKCRLIGLDLGSKRIGVSICDEKQLIATPFITIEKKSSQNLIDQLKSIIIENNIKGIIIGCLLYTSPSPRDPVSSRMPSSA